LRSNGCRHGSAFEELSRFKPRVDEVVDEFRTSRRAPGAAAPHAPRDLESQTAARNREAGIPLNETTLDDVRKAAVEVGAPDLLGV